MVRARRAVRASSAQSRLWRSSNCSTPAGSPAARITLLDAFRRRRDRPARRGPSTTSACEQRSMNSSTIQPKPPSNSSQKRTFSAATSRPNARRRGSPSARAAAISSSTSNGMRRKLDRERRQLDERVLAPRQERHVVHRLLVLVDEADAADAEPERPVEPAQPLQMDVAGGDGVSVDCRSSAPLPARGVSGRITSSFDVGRRVAAERRSPSLAPSARSRAGSPARPRRAARATSARCRASARDAPRPRPARRRGRA